MNQRAANQLGVGQAYKNAQKESSMLEYPALFIDQTPKGKMTGFQLYTNVFGRYQTVYDSLGMKGYILKEQDFNLFFEKDKNNQIKLKNECKKICDDKESNSKRKIKKRKRRLEENI